MKMKHLTLFGLSLLMLCGCVNTKATPNPTDNIDNEQNEIDSVGNDGEIIVDPQEEIIVPEIIENEEEVEININNEESSAEKEDIVNHDTEKKDEPVKTDAPQKETEKKKIEEVKKQEEEKPIETPVPTPEPTPTPTPVPVEPPKEEPKEEPKIEEEIVYGGWHESDKAQKIFNKINEVRANNGLSELPWNDNDTWLANTRVEELVNEVATNTVHSGLKKYDRYCGEIAGYGYGVSGVIDAWMASSGHANQILADYNTSMAVGVYYDEYTASSYYIVIFR